MKVLIGVDGSPGSQAAVRQATALMDTARDEVCLYCAPQEVDVRSSGSLPEQYSQVLERGQDSVANAVFDKAKALLPEALRAKVRTIVGRQSPKRGLILAAEDERADLIAVGARGAGPLSRLLLGSVSRTVAQAARVPVLIALPRSGLEPALPGPRVLITYDGSEASRQAIAALDRFTWPATSDACLLSVVEPMFAGQPPDWTLKPIGDAEIEAIRRHWTEEHARELASVRGELATLAAALPAPLRSAQTLVEEGNAAETILAAIAERQIDLLVVGARGMGAWERLLVGSTTERLLGQAPCSILVVREHELP